MIIVHVVNLNYSNSNGIKTVLSSLVPKQEELGHKVYVLNIHHNTLSLFKEDIYIKNKRVFKEKIYNIRPDILIFHGGYELKFYFYALILINLGIPYLITPHGGTSRFNLQKKRLLKTLINTFFVWPFIAHSKGVIFLNKQERNNSVFQKRLHRFYILPNGVDRHKITSDYKLASETIHFIFLSRIDIKQKGLDVLLKGYEKMMSNHPEYNCDFRFYGGRYDPKIVDEFRRIVESSNAPVNYFGEVLGREKEIAYTEAHIYVLPSLSEGMPLTVLEALSYGNPCVLTQQTNMADLILSNNAGWITEANVEALSQTLEKAYNDYKGDRVGYVKRSLQSVIPYEWEKIAEESLVIYKQSLQN